MTPLTASPAAFRERTLARLSAKQRGEVVAEGPQHDDATALGRKRNRNTARNAQRRKAITPWQWKRTLNAFGGMCAYCRVKPGIEKEHFVPLLLGGTLSVKNVVPADTKCNRQKRDTHPLPWLIERYGWISGIGLYTEISSYLASAR